MMTGFDLCNPPPGCPRRQTIRGACQGALRDTKLGHLEIAPHVVFQELLLHDVEMPRPFCRVREPSRGHVCLHSPAEAFRTTVTSGRFREGSGPERSSWCGDPHGSRHRSPNRRRRALRDEHSDGVLHRHRFRGRRRRVPGKTPVMVAVRHHRRAAFVFSSHV